MINNNCFDIVIETDFYYLNKPSINSKNDNFSLKVKYNCFYIKEYSCEDKNNCFNIKSIFKSIFSKIGNCLNSNNRNSTLTKLNKIEKIIVHKLPYSYSDSHKDVYSTWTEEEWLTFFAQKSEEIYQAYIEKHSKSHWIARTFFSDIKKVDKQYQRIMNLISPPQVLVLPNEVIQRIVNDLPLCDLAKTFAVLNYCGRMHSQVNVIKRAKEIGYKGDNPVEAGQYLENVFNKIISLGTNKLLPEKYLAWSNKKIDPEKTLKKLKILSTSDIFEIFSNPNLYKSSSFNHLSQLFNKIKYDWTISKTSSDAIKKNGARALDLAVRYQKDDIVDILLNHGADPNLKQNSWYPLHYAALAGSESIVKMLIAHGAKIDNVTDDEIGNTALFLACGAFSEGYESNSAVVQFLLGSGANPNMINKNGSSVLSVAIYKSTENIVKLLLEYQADVNAKGTDGSTLLSTAIRHAKENIVKLLLEHVGS
jgi:hypothetical protein